MIGLIAHSNKPGAEAALEDALACFRRHKADVLLEKETAKLLGRDSPLNERALAKQCQILMVLGGDGTILRVLHRLGSEIRPIFGVNIGSLGFLTCAGPQEIPCAVESLLKGDYILSRRNLLEAELHNDSPQPGRFYGLNDVVISRGEHSQLVKMSVSIDGIPFTDYNADGLIVATPTGSTAYSLSAGGPILMPESGCFVITPICPHVLTNRSTVVSDRSLIEVQVAQESGQVFVTVDGQGQHPLRCGQTLRILRSRRHLPLAMLPARLFPEVLRQKLKWSGSNI